MQTYSFQSKSSAPANDAIDDLVVGDYSLSASGGGCRLTPTLVDSTSSSSWSHNQYFANPAVATSSYYYQTGSGDLDYAAAVELKSLHFVLILFGSLTNLSSPFGSGGGCGDDSNNNSNLYANNNNNRSSPSYANTVLVDAYYLQKLILQLIDQICSDRTIRNKILYSLSELCEFS